MTITLSNTDLQDFFGEIGTNRIDNYILPGLSSIMLAGHFDAIASVRMFENTRAQQGAITPHSHRFSLACCVLRGEVHNSLYTEAVSPTAVGIDLDEYQASTLKYLGTPGFYDRAPSHTGKWRKYTDKYGVGQWYFMRHDEIHSIDFSPNARVLVIEGPDVSDTTTILEPLVNGEPVHTFEVKDWMFKKGTK
jgi:hypothetical protein